MTPRAARLVVITISTLCGIQSLSAGTLSVEERAKCQRQIEQVFWDHRIWPEHNPHPKPPLESVLPEDVLKKQVATFVSEEALLRTFWNTPITAQLLQAEIDRMVRNSKDPTVLRELFRALGDDPALVAECLARPLLVERLARSSFARDTRIHGEQRTAIEKELYGVKTLGALRKASGVYAEVDIVPDTIRVDQENAISLDAEEWSGLLRRLAGLFDVSQSNAVALLDQLPPGAVGALEETDDAFWVTALVSKSTSSLRLASMRWPKQELTAWLESSAAPKALADATGAVDLTTIDTPLTGYTLGPPAPACTDDTWRGVGANQWPAPRQGHTSVWTGSEMIVWGGTDTFDGPKRAQPAGGRYNPATDSWTPSVLNSPSAPNFPQRRTEHVAVWTGTEMIVWGGRNSAGYLNNGGRYNPTIDSWTASSLTTGAGTNVPTERTSFTAIWTGSEMIVWGGSNSTSKLKTGGRYSPTTDTWAASSLTTGAGANVPNERDRHSAVWTGSEMIIWGGTGSGFASYLDGGRYNPTTDTWAACSLTTGSGANVPTARELHTAIWTGTEMIVWGGTSLSTYEVFTGGRYNPATDTWAACSLTSGSGSNRPSARVAHTAVWTGTEMIIWGGFYSTGGNQYLPTNTGGRYNPATDTWAACSLTTGSGSNVPIARSDHTAVWTGTEMIVWGGNRNGGGTARVTLATGGRYNAAGDAWIACSLTTDPVVPPPPGRTDHSAVWTGSEMIVWGGNGWNGLSNTGATSDGGRYVSATDSWRITPLGPGSRWGHRAVWTGSEMIIRGGEYYQASSGVYRALNTGGRYNPATNTWVPSSLNSGTGANVPSPRTWHTGIWTGSEMVVWGGLGDNEVNPVRTGGRYNPATDTWAACSLTTGSGANVPTDRGYHAAVWTGSEMIVWGGQAVMPGVATGGRYNPTTDTWAACSLTSGSGLNVPSGRQSHTAVWTGSEMIIWGGWTKATNSEVKTGGRYSPNTDSWAACSLTSGTGANVPPVRKDHSAVWSGREMIIWGGNQGPASTPRQDGGRYDPSADSWAASSLSTGSGLDAPSARSRHTAIWTGREMIVWGGNNSSPAGGSLYCAATCANPYAYRDADGDSWGDSAVTQMTCTPPPGYSAVDGDCDDGNGNVWTRPGEAQALSLASDKSTMAWLQPVSLGGTSALYDVLRSGTASDFVALGTCVASGINSTTTSDSAKPMSGAVFNYLVRAANACPGAVGRGPLGFASSGTEQAGRACP